MGGTTGAFIMAGGQVKKEVTKAGKGEFDVDKFLQDRTKQIKDEYSSLDDFSRTKAFALTFHVSAGDVRSKSYPTIPSKGQKYLEGMLGEMEKVSKEVEKLYATFSKDPSKENRKKLADRLGEMDSLWAEYIFKKEFLIRYYSAINVARTEAFRATANLDSELLKSYDLVKAEKKEGVKEISTNLDTYRKMLDARFDADPEKLFTKDKGSLSISKESEQTLVFSANLAAISVGTVGDLFWDSSDYARKHSPDDKKLFKDYSYAIGTRIYDELHYLEKSKVWEKDNMVMDEKGKKYTKYKEVPIDEGVKKALSDVYTPVIYKVRSAKTPAELGAALEKLKDARIEANKLLGQARFESYVGQDWISTGVDIAVVTAAIAYPPVGGPLAVAWFAEKGGLMVYQGIKDKNTSMVVNGALMIGMSVLGPAGKALIAGREAGALYMTGRVLMLSQKAIGAYFVGTTGWMAVTALEDMQKRGCNSQNIHDLVSSAAFLGLVAVSVATARPKIKSPTPETPIESGVGGGGAYAPKAKMGIAPKKMGATPKKTVPSEVAEPVQKSKMPTVEEVVAKKERGEPLSDAEKRIYNQAGFIRNPFTSKKGKETSARTEQKDPNLKAIDETLQEAERQGLTDTSEFMDLNHARRTYEMGVREGKDTRVDFDSVFQTMNQARAKLKLKHYSFSDPFATQQSEPLNTETQQYTSGTTANSKGSGEGMSKVQKEPTRIDVTQLQGFRARARGMIEPRATIETLEEVQTNLRLRMQESTELLGELKQQRSDLESGRLHSDIAKAKFDAVVLRINETEKLIASLEKVPDRLTEPSMRDAVNINRALAENGQVKQALYDLRRYESVQPNVSQTNAELAAFTGQGAAQQGPVLESAEVEILGRSIFNAAGKGSRDVIARVSNLKGKDGRPLTTNEKLQVLDWLIDTGGLSPDSLNVSSWYNRIFTLRRFAARNLIASELANSSSVVDRAHTLYLLKYIRRNPDCKSIADAIENSTFSNNEKVDAVIKSRLYSYFYGEGNIVRTTFLDVALQARGNETAKLVSKSLELADKWVRKEKRPDYLEDVAKRAENGLVGGLWPDVSFERMGRWFGKPWTREPTTGEKNKPAKLRDWAAYVATRVVGAAALYAFMFGVHGEGHWYNKGAPERLWDLGESGVSKVSDLWSEKVDNKSPVQIEREKNEVAMRDKRAEHIEQLEYLSGMENLGPSLESVDVDLNELVKKYETLAKQGPAQNAVGNEVLNELIRQPSITDETINAAITQLSQVTAYGKEVMKTFGYDAEREAQKIIEVSEAYSKFSKELGPLKENAEFIALIKASKSPASDIEKFAVIAGENGYALLKNCGLDDAQVMSVLNLSVGNPTTVINPTNFNYLWFNVFTDVEVEKRYTAILNQLNEIDLRVKTTPKIRESVMAGLLTVKTQTQLLRLVAITEQNEDEKTIAESTRNADPLLINAKTTLEAVKSGTNSLYSYVMDPKNVPASQANEVLLALAKILENPLPGQKVTFIDQFKDKTKIYSYLSDLVEINSVKSKDTVETVNLARLNENEMLILLFFNPKINSHADLGLVFKENTVFDWFQTNETMKTLSSEERLGILEVIYSAYKNPSNTKDLSPSVMSVLNKMDAQKIKAIDQTTNNPFRLQVMGIDTNTTSAVMNLSVQNSELNCQIFESIYSLLSNVPENQRAGKALEYMKGAAGWLKDAKYGQAALDMFLVDLSNVQDGSQLQTAYDRARISLKIAPISEATTGKLGENQYTAIFKALSVDTRDSRRCEAEAMRYMGLAQDIVLTENVGETVFVDLSAKLATVPNQKALNEAFADANLMLKITPISNETEDSVGRTEYDKIYKALADIKDPKIREQTALKYLDAAKDIFLNEKLGKRALDRFMLGVGKATTEKQVNEALRRASR